MKLFSSFSYEEKKTLFIPLSVFLVIILAEIITILLLNSGLIVYTLDDAYIHLALAENIIRGHYGVNLGEFSSPSSSIFWPFILAPFSRLSFGYYIPLIINVCSSTGTLIVFWLIVKLIFLKENTHNQKMNNTVVLFTILLIVSTNLIGLIFTGMEHSFQVFLTVLIIWGLINQIHNKQISWWLLSAIILAPLIRYENIPLSIAALIFLYIYGYKKRALLSFIVIILVIGSFSIFLLNLGLEPLPLSVYRNSNIISSGGNILVLLQNLIKNFFSPRCSLLIIFLLFLIPTILSIKKNKEERLLAGCVAIAIILHLIVGKPGRYIFYIWTASILSVLYLYREWLVKVVIQNNFYKIAIATSVIVIAFSYKYLEGIVITPIGSNNIYEQQYQMHRFIVDYYKNPVSVNDLGYVSYKNDYYIMDLVGLASLEALNHWKARDNIEWINTISKEHNVKFAMIYDSWFHPIPASWHKIAELHLGKVKITPSDSVVSFYILNDNIKGKIISELEKYKPTLPKDVRLEIHYEIKNQ
jgi:hypothetical protein